jgi:hypothetical protein
MPAFAVHTLGGTTFGAVLAQYSTLAIDKLAQNARCRFLDGPDPTNQDDSRGYLERIGVKTIVVEPKYVDRDYLEDYSGYYVRCFASYDRHCVRFHFFTCEFNEDDFTAILAGTASSAAQGSLQDSYAGFLVARPLPRAIVGRTCLATYAREGRRLFPGLISVDVSLFGIQLQVQSVPFQEQDQVTSACATSALWSAFYVSARKFGHAIPSPVEITKGATTVMPIRSRSLPNTDGLTVEQMAHAVRQVGLEPLYLRPTTPDMLRAIVHAYSSASIPVLLIFALFRQDLDGSWAVVGHHAATVTGYSLPEGPSPDGWVSQSIDKLYVHDDQVGPFARMELTPPSCPPGPAVYLHTSWGFQPGTAVCARIDGVLIPTHHKIRLPYSFILEVVRPLASSLEQLGREVPTFANFFGDLTWDIHLSDVRSVKAEAIRTGIPGPERAALLTQSMPKHLWRAVATRNGQIEIELLFDATDIASGKNLCLLRTREASAKLVLQSLAQTNASHPLVQPIARVLELLSSS